VTSQDLRRLAIALACSIAIHEIAAALIPRTAGPSQERETVTHVTIARVQRRVPSPTPKPTPTPPPPRLIVRAQVAAGAHAHVEPVKHAGARRPTPPKVQFETPAAALPTGGQGAGAQRGSAAGSTSAQEGAGNGTGAAGPGNGGNLCGAVDFQSTGIATYDPETETYDRSNIVATVYYADGTSERIPLDWTWQWKSEDDDPFNTDQDAPMLFQFPPAGKIAGEPPAIQYIIAHTTRDGRTKLTDRCPNIPPPPPTPHESPAAAPVNDPPERGG